MDDETRAAFARIDRWFERSQEQYNDLRSDIAELRQEVGELRQEVGALREEFYRFRDWVTVQFAEIRLALQQLTVPVERLELRRSDSIG